MVSLPDDVLLASEGSDDASHQDARELHGGGNDPLATRDLTLDEVTDVGIRAWRDPAAAGRLPSDVVAPSDPHDSTPQESP